MSGAMRKMGVYLGLLEDTERYDDDVLRRLRRAATQPPAPARPTSARAAAVASWPSAAARVRHRAGRARSASSPSSPGSPRCTRAPTTRRAPIGENFREGIPVIMNLSEMDDADAKRLVDFAAGLVFAVHGTIERVTNKVFLLSPPNVAVAPRTSSASPRSGFFNQS